MKTPEQIARELYGTSKSNKYSIKLSELQQAIYLRGYNQCSLDNAQSFKRIADLANGMLDVVKDAPEDECTQCDDEGLYECDPNNNGHDVVAECGCGKSDRLSK